MNVVMIPLPTFRYRAHVLEVHDGDTFTVGVDLGFRTFVNVELRVRGVDAPELSTKEGQVAREWAASMLLGRDVVIESFKTKGGKDVRTFARWVADVWLGLDGKSYADLLREQGHVKP